MKIKLLEVKDNNDTLHLETILIEEAKRFVSNYNTAHGVVLKIFEVDYTPVDHRLRIN